MRRPALALAALLVPIAVFAADKPRAPKQYTIEQFMKTTAMGGASFSADDSRILFHSNETGHLQRLLGAGRRRQAHAAHAVEGNDAVGELLPG
jgi:hypothetical protein